MTITITIIVSRSSSGAILGPLEHDLSQTRFTKEVPNPGETECRRWWWCVGFHVRAARFLPA